MDKTWEQIEQEFIRSQQSGPGLIEWANDMLEAITENSAFFTRDPDQANRIKDELQGIAAAIQPGRNGN